MNHASLDEVSPRSPCGAWVGVLSVCASLFCGFSGLFPLLVGCVGVCVFVSRGWLRATRTMDLACQGHSTARRMENGRAKKKDHWVRRYVRGGSVQKLDWLVVEEITQLDMALWADLACVGLNDVNPAAGRLPAVAGRAGLLGRAAHQRAVGAQPAHPRPGRRAQAQAHGEHALRPRHLQLREVAAGRRGGVPHAGAGQGELKELFPSKPGWPDTTLVISHSKRMAVNAAANRALAPEASST